MGCLRQLALTDFRKEITRIHTNVLWLDAMNLLCFVLPLYDGVLMINHNDTDVNILLTPDSSIYAADGIEIVSKPTVIYVIVLYHDCVRGVTIDTILYKHLCRTVPSAPPLRYQLNIANYCQIKH